MIKDDTELDRHRQAAMQRVLARQRETQRKAKEEHQQHVERRMNAILSLRKNITASEVRGGQRAGRVGPGVVVLMGVAPLGIEVLGVELVWLGAMNWVEMGVAEN